MKMSDLIDRQAAIDAIDIGCELLRRALDDTDVVGVERAKYEWGLGLIESYIADIKELPSAQPERIKGRWVGTDYDGFADGNPVYDEWKCSECGCVVEDEEPTWNYCPNCGADMRGEA